jgi:hypothetical protein
MPGLNVVSVAQRAGSNPAPRQPQKRREAMDAETLRKGQPDAPDCDRLRAENARLRVLLDAALDDHLESRMGACDDDCWCWAAEKVLEDTK